MDADADWSLWGISSVSCSWLSVPGLGAGGGGGAGRTGSRTVGPQPGVGCAPVSGRVGSGRCPPAIPGGGVGGAADTERYFIIPVRENGPNTFRKGKN